MPLSRNATVSPGVEQDKITLLWITGSREDEAVLHHIFANPRWQIRVASGLHEAQTAFQEQDIAVVLCERQLQGERWQSVMEAVARAENAPPVVVISRTADPELWAEVLNVGGYDVLLRPFDTSEVLRVVGMAWRQHQSALHRSVKAALVH